MLTDRVPLSLEHSILRSIIVTCAKMKERVEQSQAMQATKDHHRHLLLKIQRAVGGARFENYCNGDRPSNLELSYGSGKLCDAIKAQLELLKLEPDTDEWSNGKFFFTELYQGYEQIRETLVDFYDEVRLFDARDPLTVTMNLICIDTVHKLMLDNLN